jgi:cell division transport system permease protein
MFRKKDKNTAQKSSLAASGKATSNKGASRKGATFKQRPDSVKDSSVSVLSEKKKRTASLAGISKPKAKWQAHKNYHKQCAKSSWQRLSGSRLATGMTASLIAVSLALPMLLLLVVSNLQKLSSGWEDQLSVSVYLNVGTVQQKAKELTQDISELNGVSSVRLISPEEGLTEFKALAGAELLGLFDRNPLPSVIELIPAIDRDQVDAGFQLSELVRSIESMSGIDEVVYDVAWVERLISYISLAERFAMLVGCLLALAVVLAISNSIRLEIENRRQEIIVIKLVGGTDSFIRLPFLYSGFWYGVLGASLATLSLLLISLWLSPLVGQLVSLYSSDVDIHYLSLLDIVWLYLFAIVLAVAGAWLAVYRHLGEIEPE